MTIYALKSRFQAFLRPLVRALYDAGTTANQITIVACIISIGLAFAIARGPRGMFFLLPVWMLLRMALNAIDGMLARELGQKSRLGAYLNELTDVVSDAALYLPFGIYFGWLATGAAIFAAALSEMTGVLGLMVGASRRYDGPMGKSDRAFVFSLLALWISFANVPAWGTWVMWAITALTAWTIVNRVRAGLRESTTLA
jgi:CDP-diacylglycerol--glycerol-3-phosphate 3-phosphatidyltransferase